jgi:serine/threonine protein kinase
VVEGTPFGRYRLIELLGRGGMGEVWRAFDTVTERVVAIKVLPAQYVNDEIFQQRFRREARSAAALNDPHVVPIHDFGEIDGRLYVTMRLIEGRDLQTILVGGPLEPARAVHIVEQVASALNAAHRVELVHRDVKPSNILVGEDDFAYLIDFGIARNTSDTSLTNAGKVLGTYAYLAPERLTTGQADHRADIYSLTCVMHECLTGKQPFPGDSLEQVVGGHLTQPPPRPTTLRHNLPTGLDAVIARGLAKNPDERYATTKELASAARSAITAPIPVPQPAWPTHPAHDPQHGGWSTPPRQFGPAVASTPYGPTAAPTPYGPVPGPTQYGPVPATTQYGQAPGPTAPRPFVGPHGNGQRRRNRGWIAVAAAAVVALVITAVLVVAFANRGDQVGSPDASGTSSTPAPNTGPFTGVYRVDFGPANTHDGAPIPGSAASTGQWSVRSSCHASTCVATATAKGGPTLLTTFTFDKVRTQWQAVSANLLTAPPPGEPGFNTCRFPSEYWTVITLQGRSEGTLSGTYRADSNISDCGNERTVTFTRTGDVDVGSLPDPDTQAALVTSPASAFHGRYNGTQTPDDTHRPTSWHTTFTTYCLRTGERCASYAAYKEGDELYIFSGGKWTYDYEGKSHCNAGGDDQIKVHWEFPLPQPKQDPIAVLTGRGHKQVVGTACAGGYNEDIKFERTSD